MALPGLPRSYRRYGQEREVGIEKVRRRLILHPAWATVLPIILYIFFSDNRFGFFPIIPLWIGWMNLFWAAFLLFAIYSIINKEYFPIVAFAIVFPILNYTVAQAFVQPAQLWAEEIREKYSVATTGISDPFGRNPKSIEKVPVKGVDINIPQLKGSYKEGQPLLLSAKVTVDGFGNDPDDPVYQPLHVAFSCYSSNANNTKVATGTVSVQNTPGKNFLIVEPREGKTTYDLQCLFSKGLKVDESTRIIGTSAFNFSLGQIGSRGAGAENKSKNRVFIEATTKFTQTTWVKLWVVDKDYDPEKLPIVDPDLLIDGRSRVNCEYGCGAPYGIDITVGTQPITSEQTPLLEVGVLKNKNIRGLLTKLESIHLDLPRDFGIVWVTEYKVGEEETPLDCDFDAERKVKGEKLEEANKQLATYLQKLNKGEPVQEPLINFNCLYRLTQLPGTLEQDSLQQDFIRARIIYHATVSKWTLVDVYKDLSLGETT